MNVLALCAGHGGIERGLQSIFPDLCVVASVEKEPYRQRLLRGWVWDDLTTFDGHPFAGCVDLVSSGFPCQPFSTASRGRRVATDLLPHVLRVVREVGPDFVFLENVQEDPIARAARALSDRDFHTIYCRSCPSEMGAAMRRPRWWLLAYAHDALESTLPVDAEMARIRAAAQFDKWQKGPGGILGMDVRDPDRSNRIRCMGDSVVPLEAERNFFSLWSGLNL